MLGFFENEVLEFVVVPGTVDFVPTKFSATMFEVPVRSPLQEYGSHGVLYASVPHHVHS